MRIIRRRKAEITAEWKVAMMDNIPSDEDLARASRMMEERFRNLDEVSEKVIQYFKDWRESNGEQDEPGIESSN